MEDKKMMDGEFIPVSDDYGNELSVYSDDFKELANLPRGTEVLLMVKCGIKGKRNTGECVPCNSMQEKPRPKVELFVWSAHVCEVEDVKEEMKQDMSNLKKALAGSGRQVDGVKQDTFYPKE